MGWNESDKEDARTYKVVVNHEEQYAIWLEHKQLPNGWRYAGKTGPKADCLAFIREAWTDMRPLSLRKKLDELAKNPLPSVSSDPGTPVEKALVDRLCDGDHSVEVGLRAEKNAKLFKKAIDNGYVHIKFTETRGGTEIGMRMNGDASDLSAADFANGKGSAHVEGTLMLDYVKVRCIADIDLNTLKGRGRLIRT